MADAQKPKRAKVAVPVSELEQHLLSQIGYLQRSIGDFDGGQVDEYRRLALTIRVLAHESRTSRSLLGQLGLRGEIRAYSPPVNPNNLMTEFTVAGTRLTDVGIGYFPVLKSAAAISRLVSFDAWWTEAIIVDSERNELSRRDIVRAVADQDGGAHVDSDLDPVYHALAKLNSLGWTFTSFGIDNEARHAEKIAIRHIAFELLEHLETTFLPAMGRKGCACGSGKAARYCCLEPMMHRRGLSGEMPLESKALRRMSNLPHGVTITTMRLTGSLDWLIAGVR